jgi:hypothetical protein
MGSPRVGSDPTGVVFALTPAPNIDDWVVVGPPSGYVMREGNV